MPQKYVFCGRFKRNKPTPGLCHWYRIRSKTFDWYPKRRIERRYSDHPTNGLTEVGQEPAPSPFPFFFYNKATREDYPMQECVSELPTVLERSFFVFPMQSAEGWCWWELWGPSDTAYPLALIIHDKAWLLCTLITYFPKCLRAKVEKTRNTAKD